MLTHAAVMDIEGKTTLTSRAGCDPIPPSKAAASEKVERTLGRMLCLYSLRERRWMSFPITC